MRPGLGSLLTALVEVVADTTDDEDAEDDERADRRAIALDGLGKELGRYGLTDEVAEECQDDVPRSSTDGGVEEEATEAYLPALQG